MPTLRREARHDGVPTADALHVADPAGLAVPAVQVRLQPGIERVLAMQSEGYNYLSLWCPMTESLGEALPREIARVRDKVMPAYQAIGSAGEFALIMMRHDLDAAAQAMAERDTVRMIRQLEALRGYET